MLALKKARKDRATDEDPKKTPTKTPTKAPYSTYFRDAFDSVGGKNDLRDINNLYENEYIRLQNLMGITPVIRKSDNRYDLHIKKEGGFDFIILNFGDKIFTSELSGLALIYIEGKNIQSDFLILDLTIKSISYVLMYPLKFIKYLVKKINEKIGYEYIVINCRDGLEEDILDNYTCGRAVQYSSIGKSLSYTDDEDEEKKIIEKKEPKIIIYNTISTEDMGLDTEYYNKIKDDPKKCPEGKTGECSFYKKYLKYKVKYLKIKKMRNLL